MVLCSLKIQQLHQWIRLYCLYLHLPKSTFLVGLWDSEGQIKMARDGLEESVCDRALWCTQSLPPQVRFWVSSSPIDLRDFLGSLSHCILQSACPLDERLGYWRHVLLSMGCGMQVQPSSFSRSGSGLAWTATETQCALHCIEQPMQLVALPFFLTLKHQEVKNVLWSKHVLEALHLKSAKTWIGLMLKLSWQCYFYWFFS